MSDDESRDGHQKPEAEQRFWDALATLYRWRRLLLGVTGGVALLSAVISLLVPSSYRAQTRLIVPDRSSSGLISSAFVENLPAAARSLVGADRQGYLRYLTVLSSRTMFEEVVRAFDLVSVYGVEDSRAPAERAARRLRARTAFTVDNEYDFLTVSVEDTDPKRAADMANFFVAELERMNSRLAARSASNFRGFVARRYAETTAALDSVQREIRAFQETHGVLDLAAQGQRFFEYVGELRLAALRAEVEYEALLSQFGPENSIVRSAQQTARSADEKYQQALAGQERILPVATDSLPGIQAEYVALERERLILERLLLYVRPVLEEATFDAERQVEAVQVVDPAVPPSRRSRPRRKLMVIVSTLSALMLAVAFVLVYDWWRSKHAYFAHRLARAISRSPDPSPGDVGGSPREPGPFDP